MNGSVKTEGFRGPRRLRIYTKTGDKGTSSLYNGKRATKAAAVFDALGDTDELNASIGLALEHCAVQAGDPADAEWLTLISRLSEVQSRLLDAGSAIATPLDESTPEQLARAAFPEAPVSDLENWIDEMEESLPPLRNFILPVCAFASGHPCKYCERACVCVWAQSGGLASASLHVARTVCRRAERSVVSLAEGTVPPVVGRFMNR